MNRIGLRTDVRQVSDFNRVSIRGNTCSTRLIINQGRQERLTIEAPPEYLQRLHSEVRNKKLTVRLGGGWLQELKDALTTGLNQPTILYRLDVCELTALDVQCVYSVHLSRLETPHLHIKLNGTGEFRIDSLLADTLKVQHSGSGTMSLSGQVEHQEVVLNGIGSYFASGLESQQARVHMSGTGLARLRVSQALDATLRGVGTLEYSGDPTVNKRISGPGQLRHIADLREKAL